MSITIRQLSVCLTMFLVTFGLACPPVPSPGVIDDDDTVDDDDDDDDDDDQTPTYDGEVDLDGADLASSCDVTVPSNSGDGGEGSFDYEMTLSGWAEMCWIELWDLTSSYCEGYDPDSWEPCDNDGTIRPGWEMVNTDFGWNSGDGFWDEWILHLLYQDTWPPLPDKSTFVCEDVHNNFQTWYCCSDIATDNNFCTQYTSW